MAHIINLKSFTDERGSLTALEDRDLPFKIKRVFYIYGTREDVTRGKHRHKATIQAMTCLSGSCSVYNHNGKEEENFVLDSPNKCLILEPEDWHSMTNFSDNCVIQVLASKYYDPKDYIYEPY